MRSSHQASLLSQRLERSLGFSRMVRIHSIQTGRVRVREAQRARRRNGVGGMADMLFDPTWTAWLPILCWLIENEEGLILVDTGETARVLEPSYHPSWHPFYRRAVQFDIHPEEEIGPQLRRLGFSSRDVKQVVLTHLHTDHAGGLHHLTGAKFWVAQREWRRAQGLSGRVQGYLPHRWPRWWQPEFIRFEDQPMGPFDRSMAITRLGDVRIVPTPGHTPDHVSVLVEGTPSFFLAGDTSYSQELLQARRIDGVSPSPAVSLKTTERILALASQRELIYLPSHDIEAERRLRHLSPIQILGSPGNSAATAE
jgi:N-acyl homoserine lactone hydrolase